VKYLPYPPLQRITFGCDTCNVTAVVFSYYAEACHVRVGHLCVREVPTGKLSQTKTRVTMENLTRR